MVGSRAPKQKKKANAPITVADVGGELERLGGKQGNASSCDAYGITRECIKEFPAAALSWRGLGKFLRSDKTLSWVP